MKYDIDIFPLVDATASDGTPGMGCTIEPGQSAWRWMAVLHWRTPRHGRFPGFTCRRSMDPVKLARWAYMVLAREVQP